MSGGTSVSITGNRQDKIMKDGVHPRMESFVVRRQAIGMASTYICGLVKCP